MDLDTNYVMEAPFVTVGYSVEETIVIIPTSREERTLEAATYQVGVIIPGVNVPLDSTLPEVAPEPDSTLPEVTPEPESTLPEVAPEPESTLPEETPEPESTLPEETPEPESTLPEVTPDLESTLPEVTPEPESTLPEEEEKTHWATEFIEDMMAQGFITGKTDANFDPDATLTLGEFAVMLTNGFYGETLARVVAETSSSEAWWRPYLNAIQARNGLLSTVAEEESQWLTVVHTSITRYDMAVMIYNLLQDRGITTLSEQTIHSTLRGFTDQIDVRYQKAVAYSNYYGFLEGNLNGTFQGEGLVTRGQSAVVLSGLVSSAHLSTEEYQWYQGMFSPEVEEVVTSKWLNVPLLYQKDTLPEGCEVTSLAGVLNYYGFEVSKEILADQFLPCVSVGATIKNPEEAYIGNPRNSGWYCFEQPIVYTANDYFSSIGSDCWAMRTEITTIDQFIEYIDKEVPVIAWATTNYGTPIRSSSVKWNTGYGTIQPYVNLHCVTLVGYDSQERLFYLADSLQPTGNQLVQMDMDKFMWVYQSMGSRSMIVVAPTI